jgi:lipopolysaccharide export system ATP-binding protein
MLVVKNIGKTSGGKKIVKDICLKVEKANIIGLLGPNGAGKTTSFYIIAGLIKPDHGHVFLDNQEITNLPMFARARLGISYLPQESSIFRGMTVLENIISALEIHHSNNAESTQKSAEALMEELSIAHLCDVQASNLSGGERRRAEIARCLATDPQYVLFDEPLAGIDPIAIEDVIKVILKLKKRGIGVLITDHNVKEALDLIDYAYIVYNGSILAEGEPKKVIKHQEVRKLYLGENF